MKIPKEARITLDMLRRVKRQSRRANVGYNHPCTKQIDRVIKAHEANDFGPISDIWKFVKDMDNCVEYYRDLKKRSSKPSTNYYLSRFLDQQKFKKK